MPQITGFHHVSLTVSDRARSAAWYSQVFGFKTIREVEDDGSRGGKTVMVLPERQLIISLCHHRSNPGQPFSEFRTGLDHIAFEVATRAELQAWSAELDQHDVPHSEIKESLMGPLIAFRDPDNIQLEVYVTEHPPADQKALGW